MNFSDRIAAKFAKWFPTAGFKSGMTVAEIAEKSEGLDLQKDSALKDLLLPEDLKTRLEAIESKSSEGNAGDIDLTPFAKSEDLTGFVSKEEITSMIEKAVLEQKTESDLEIEKLKTELSGQKTAFAKELNTLKGGNSLGESVVPPVKQLGGDEGGEGEQKKDEIKFDFDKALNSQKTVPGLV